ncbi:MAG: hypothetical protein ACR2K0_01065 [Acidimicrobiales bacterium]
MHGSAEDRCANLQAGGDPAPSPGGTFCDTVGHTHEASIHKVAAAGIAQGGSAAGGPAAGERRGQERGTSSWMLLICRG